MSSRTILLLTHSRDFYTVDNVERAVSRLGYRPLRFNTDYFPENLQLTVRLEGSAFSLTLDDGSSGLSLNASEVRSVWLRKIGSPNVNPEMDKVLRDGCIRESREALDIFLNQLHMVPWVDRLAETRRASDKLFQLKTARSVGLPVPNTLITNRPEQVRRFFHAHHGNIVAKMLTPLSVSMAGGTPFVYTSRIKESDLDDLHQLQFSPMVFQEFIPKECELRIAYVNGQLFTGAIAGDQTDWRNQGPNSGSPWQHFALPEEWADKIRAFMKEMALYFGAIDVIVKPDGSFVFLEVNPNGEWGMLEKDLELPISTAIAETLTSI